jgi:hypothetical protein
MLFICSIVRPVYLAGWVVVKKKESWQRKRAEKFP